MAAAIAAHHFGPSHPVAAVGLRLDGVRVGGGVETRPAGAGLELLVGVKQDLAATSTAILAWLFGVGILARERALRALLPEDVGPVPAQLPAPPPLRPFHLCFH